VAGGAQEHPGLALALGAGSAAWLVRRRPGSWLALRLAAGVGVGVATRLVWPVAPKSPAAVAPHRAYTDLAPADDGAGLSIVVNPGAGSGSVGSAESPAAALRHALPAAEVVELGEDDDLVDELERRAKGGARAIGVAGGDGSINAAAAVALDHRLPLVVVPAGTLNHLARDLGVETVDDTIDAVRRHRRVRDRQERRPPRRVHAAPSGVTARNSVARDRCRVVTCGRDVADGAASATWTGRW
jgi:hypothetical protein